MSIADIEEGSPILTLAIILSERIPQIEQKYPQIIEFLKSKFNTPYGKSIIGNISDEPAIEFPEDQKIVEFMNDKSINILQNVETLDQIDINEIKEEIQKILSKQKNKNLEFIFNHFDTYVAIGEKIREDVKKNDIEFIIIGETIIANKYYDEYQKIKNTIDKDKQVECFLYHGKSLCNQRKIIRDHFLRLDEVKVENKLDKCYFGKGIYATDNIFNASMYSNGYELLEFNDKISVLGCIAIYNEDFSNNIEDIKSYKGKDLPKDVIENYGIHRALVGSKLGFEPIKEEEKDQNLIVANEFVFHNEYQIIPLCSFTIMKTSYYVLWVDETSKYSKHCDILKEEIKENVYYVNTIEEASKILNLKKRNAVKLIISFDDEEFANNIISIFREVYKSNVVCLIYDENPNRSEFASSENNVLFANEMELLKDFANIDMNEENLLKFSEDISDKYEQSFTLDSSSVNFNDYKNYENKDYPKVKGKGKKK